jgi:hypothetical protein
VIDCVQEFYADWLPRSVSPRQIVESLKIPHHSYFGFGERLAVMEQSTADPMGLAFVYEKVAAFLAGDFKDLTPFVGEQAARAGSDVKLPPEATTPQVATSRGYEYDVFVSFDRSLTDWVVEFVDALKPELAARQAEQIRIFKDIREVNVGSQWRDEISVKGTTSSGNASLHCKRVFCEGIEHFF